jgi:hypothetical protein
MVKKLTPAVIAESDGEALWTELAKQAGVRVKHFAGFDFRDVKRELDSGRPVVVLRAYVESRQVFLREFTRNHAKDPNLELPKPGDPKDQAKWATVETADYSLDSLITGYNAKRGEIFVSQPGWAVSHQQMRMRIEELQAGAYDTYFFSGN